jgi:phosphoglycerol transferase MdoB-like AlkP superfamily enzyme
MKFNKIEPILLLFLSFLIAYFTKLDYLSMLLLGLVVIIIFVSLKSRRLSKKLNEVDSNTVLFLPISNIKRKHLEDLLTLPIALILSYIALSLEDDPDNDFNYVLQILAFIAPFLYYWVFRLVQPIYTYGLFLSEECITDGFERRCYKWEEVQKIVIKRDQIIIHTEGKKLCKKLDLADIDTLVKFVSRHNVNIEYEKPR